MKINIAQVAKAIGERQSFSFLIPLEPLADGHDLWLKGQAEIAGEIVNNGRFLQVAGTIKARAAGICCRCLEDFATPVTIPFVEDYREAGSPAVDADQAVYAGDELDITPLIREAIILAEPLKALCCEDCKGLCPQCGTNLNQSACDCDSHVVDPRLAALEKLLTKK